MQRIDLDPFREYLISRIRKGVVNGHKLFLEIQPHGFHGSYETLYRYLRNDLNNYWIKPYRKNHYSYYKNSAIILSKYKSAKRFETEPGQQAQVDWGHFQTVILNGRKKKLYCFIFVLGYSRAIYIEFTTSENLAVFESCHINAFKALGIPNSIVYDNTKTAILFNKRMPDGKRKIDLNVSFLDFACYYGFEIIASPPYWPRNKGKVESSVKYIRNHFWQGMRFIKNINSLEELNQKAKDWVNQVANNRIHTTTQEKPMDRWLKEKPNLKFPKDLPDYQVSPFLCRFSNKDQFIQYKQNFYSVPKEYSWRKLFIREIDTQGNRLVTIYFKGKLITQHNLCTERGKYIENPLHFQHNLSTCNSQGKVKTGRHRTWNKYPEIPIRPFEFYDQLVNEK